jgi:hypothetical protein
LNTETIAKAIYDGAEILRTVIIAYVHREVRIRLRRQTRQGQLEKRFLVRWNNDREFHSDTREKTDSMCLCMTPSAC